MVTALSADLVATLRGMSPLDSLPEGLPAGRLIVADPDFADDMWAGRALLWVTDEPVSGAGDWWLRLQSESGLYVMLLQALHGEPGRPWHDGELSPVTTGAIDTLTANGVLRRLWPEVDDDELPFEAWPGLAPPGKPAEDPFDAARTLAADLSREGEWLVGLIPSPGGADALGAVGWNGPCNHAGVAEISAVLRSWEDRYGVRVVGAGFDTLEVSVAAPPATIEEARHLAAEHHAFCPDNIWQGGVTYEEYAESLLGSARWSFWWD